MTATFWIDPEQLGYSHPDTPAWNQSEVGVPGKYYGGQSLRPLYVDVQWQFDKFAHQYFMSFWRTSINFGMNQFLVQLILDRPEPDFFRVRIVPESLSMEKSKETNTVRCQLVVDRSSVVTQDEIEVPPICNEPPSLDNIALHIPDFSSITTGSTERQLGHWDMLIDIDGDDGMTIKDTRSPNADTPSLCQDNYVEMPALWDNSQRCPYGIRRYSSRAELGQNLVVNNNSQWYGLNPFTIMGWFKCEESPSSNPNDKIWGGNIFSMYWGQPNQPDYDEWPPAAYFYYGFQVNASVNCNPATGALQLSVKSGDGGSEYTNYNDKDYRGRWTHVAMTRIFGTTHFIVDGVYRGGQNDSSFTSWANSNPARITIGSGRFGSNNASLATWSPGVTFGGDIQDFIIYTNFQPTAEQVMNYIYPQS